MTFRALKRAVQNSWKALKKALSKLKDFQGTQKGIFKAQGPSRNSKRHFQSSRTFKELEKALSKLCKDFQALSIAVQTRTRQQIQD